MDREETIVRSAEGARDQTRRERVCDTWSSDREGRRESPSRKDRHIVLFKRDNTAAKNTATTEG